MARSRISKAYYEPARWYDLRDFSKLHDVEFFLRMAEKHGPCVLECGSGTGRIAIPLAQAGSDLVGIDRDSAMLKRARAKWKAVKEEAKGAARFLKADMTRFSLHKRFDVAFVAFNTFLTLAALEDRLAMLRCVRRHLVPGGRLIVDIYQPSIATLSGDQPERLDFTLDDPKTGCIVKRYSWVRRDMAAQQAQVSFEYRYTQPDGTTRSEKTSFPMCIIFPAEMRLLFHITGYEVEHVYGNHDMAPFHKNSPLMIFVARRLDRAKKR